RGSGVLHQQQRGGRGGAEPGDSPALGHRERLSLGARRGLQRGPQPDAAWPRRGEPRLAAENGPLPARPEAWQGLLSHHAIRARHRRQLSPAITATITVLIVGVDPESNARAASRRKVRHSASTFWIGRCVRKSRK